MRLSWESIEANYPGTPASSCHTYDMLGRRVPSDYKGLVIRNGKKMLLGNIKK